MRMDIVCLKLVIPIISRTVDVRFFESDSEISLLSYEESMTPVERLDQIDRRTDPANDF